MKLSSMFEFACLGVATVAGLVLQSGSGLCAPLGAPASFDVANRTPILVAQGWGVQLYECKPVAAGGDAWTFREPIATLISQGKTVGRHYAGPTWALDDGGAVKGKLLASVPGVTTGDVPLLKLGVVEHSGSGLLQKAEIVLRLNTHGGALKGACPTVGELRAEPYLADYVFLPYPAASR